MSVPEEIFVKQDVVQTYVKARPTYPPALFEKLSSLTQKHERAWDVGTGNGQAAIGVAEFYKSVVATDISYPQISLAMPRDNITYATMSATPSHEELERIVGPEGSVDLVTVATALIWFDLDKFYPIVKHVLHKPGGVFAAWTYDRVAMQVSTEFDAAMARWYEALNPYRPVVVNGNPFPLRKLKDMPFPFNPVPGVELGKGVQGNPEVLKLETSMSFDDVLLFSKTFPPVQAALEKGVDLLDEDARQALSKAWGAEKVRTVVLPIYLLMGTVPTG